MGVGLAMSLGYFMNTRWGGLAAAVAAQQATNDELHALNPSAIPHHYSEENSNPFAFTLPYGAPLSIPGSFPQHHSHSSGATTGNNGGPTYHQQQQQHHHHHHPHNAFAPSVELGAALSGGLGIAGPLDVVGRLTSPSMPHLCGLDERTIGHFKSLYPPPPPLSGGSLLGQIDDSSSMLWQPHQQSVPVAVPPHPHHSLPLPTSSSNTHPSLNSLGNNGQQQQQQHLSSHPSGVPLLPILTPHVQSSEMPSDSPPSQQQSSSSGSKSNGTGNGVVTKPKAKPRQPEEVLKYFSNVLTPYECQEILNYPHVYFIGAMAKKRPIMSTHNSGYDDEQDSYIHVVHDHVAYRYEVLKVIGKGSFGQVVKAYDHKNHVYVALKMVRNQPRFHRQAQEEIKILEHLKKQDKDNKMNVIHLHDCFVFRNHVCITFELLSINLYELIKKNKFQGFSLQLVRKFAHSLLQCLEALARNRIIHCDMKPENVLLKQQGRSGIKVSRRVLITIIINIFPASRPPPIFLYLKIIR